MKHLKSSSADLRDLFKDSITVKYLAEPLKSVPACEDAAKLRSWMEARDFDVLGIEENGTVCGYVERSHLGKGKCNDYQQIFHPSELIAAATPLMELLPLLREKPRLFVLESNRINGIVTCGDLQKAPVRMLLFGLVTLLEMNSTGLIAKVISKRTEELISPMQEDFSFEALVSTIAGLLVVRVC